MNKLVLRMVGVLIDFGISWIFIKREMDKIDKETEEIFNESMECLNKYFEEQRKATAEAFKEAAGLDNDHNDDVECFKERCQEILKKRMNEAKTERERAYYKKKLDRMTS